MKKLLIIPLLFACYMVMGQAVDSASIIGKSIRAGNFVYSQFDGSKVVAEYDFPNNLVVAQYDFPNQMNWDDAKRACAALGKGWRLPNECELNILYQNKDKIGGFANNDYYNQYWSSTGSIGGFAMYQNFDKNGYKGSFEIGTKLYVRAIRNLETPKDNINYKNFIGKTVSIYGIGKIDSASIIGKSIRVGNLVVAQYDFPYRMNWYDAIIACAALGKGWRLPTKEQLNSLYKNKQKISDFQSIYYWSSTEVDCEDAWVQNVYEGGLIKQDKKGGQTVRAIRAF